MTSVTITQMTSVHSLAAVAGLDGAGVALVLTRAYVGGHSLAARMGRLEALILGLADGTVRIEILARRPLSARAQVILGRMQYLMSVIAYSAVTVAEMLVMAADEQRWRRLGRL